VTVGKLSVLAWSMFAVMSAAFIPVGAAIAAIPGLPEGVSGTVAAAVVVVLWWGPFGYGMYLAYVGMQGDRRLLKRGKQGQGTILDAALTGTRIGGGSDYGGARVRKYRVKVEVPGWEPYETVVRSTQTEFGPGDAVTVFAAPHNRARVALAGVVSSSGRGGRRSSVYGLSPMSRGVRPFASSAPTGQRDVAQQLADLASMHRQGEITDEEFAKAKAQLLR